MADKIDPDFGGAAERMTNYIARVDGIDLSTARRSVKRRYDAMGVALIALANGDMPEALKIMAPFKKDKHG